MHMLGLSLFLIATAEVANAASRQEILAVVDPSPRGLMITGLVSLIVLAIFLRRKLG